MAKYVDIDAVKEAVRKAECDANWDERRFDAEFIEDALDFISAADVAPVVHGRWMITEGRIENAVCSNCGRHFQPYYEAYRYCSNCGCRMVGGDNTER